jgi:hypothetical protein
MFLKSVFYSRPLSFIPICIFLIVACTPTVPQSSKKTITLPAGWYLSLNNAKVNLIKAEEQKTGYKIEFDRAFEVKDSEYYLAIAEGIFPERNVILKSAINNEKSWFFERLWWDEEYKNCLIPFAITGDAINYYIERYKQIKSQSKGEEQPDRTRGSNLKRIEFFYLAKVIDEGSVIIAETSFPKKRVTMEMKWYEYCGQPCGWGFEKHREVVFAGKNIVLSVTGDGTAVKWISSQQNPYGPNQWIRF